MAITTFRKEETFEADSFNDRREGEGGGQWELLVFC